MFAHHSRNITAENNILALNRTAQVDRGGIGGFELTCQRNLIYYLEGKAVGDYGIGRCGRDVCAFDRNLYWNASGKPVLFGNNSFAEWQVAGQDLHSIVADPLFVDPDRGDFRLRPSSPAAQIGFEPWDLMAVGPPPHSAASKQTLVSALGDAGSAPAQPAPNVGKHKMLELIFTAAGTPANPFDTYLLKLEVTDPTGRLPMADQKRFMRYAMARTSALSHLGYVLCFEWQEAWSKADVNEAGRFIQAHNPWKRLLSVHDWAGRPWAFVGATWPTYIASQDGNDANPDAVNSYVISLRAHGLPVLPDELGSNRTDGDARIRGNMWAAFCAGAAGTGTGTDLRAFQRFLAQSRIPFQRMEPSNELVQGGGSSRFCLAESGHHYLVYSITGSFGLSVTGAGLTGRWFNPRDPNAALETSFGVSSGTSTYTPPDTARDWALWITDGTKLNSGVTRLSTEATVIQIVVGAGSQIDTSKSRV